MKSRQTLPCGFLEDDLIAVALGEASVAMRQSVEVHLRSCPSCLILLNTYRQLCAQLDSLPGASEEEVLRARRTLNARLPSPRRPRLLLALWHSPVGDIRIGKTEKGVALVEFIRPPEGEAVPSRLAREFTVEEDGEDLRDLVRRLEEYLAGKRKNLGWIVDEAFVRSPFQKEVLRATAEVPYGTVITYQGIAEFIGRSKAVRAVAQALRYNPVPIHIPCHRVVGSDGNLTGYAGNRVELKRQLLALEGVPVTETPRGLCVPKGQMYLGWKTDKLFCLPTCPTVKNLRPGDRILIPSQVHAEELGFLACDMCRPDLHPLACKTGEAGQ